MRGSDEPVSLVAMVRHSPSDREAELGRSILLNPSCPPAPSVPSTQRSLTLSSAALFYPDREKRLTHARLKKPAIGEVQVHLLAQPALGVNAKAVADDQHPDHQFRVYRGPTYLAVERLEGRAQVGQVHEAG